MLKKKAVIILVAFIVLLQFIFYVLTFPHFLHFDSIKYTYTLFTIKFLCGAFEAEIIAMCSLFCAIIPS